MTYGDGSRPDTVFGTAPLKLTIKPTIKPVPILKSHSYVRVTCNICTSCGTCTHNGPGCILCGPNDRSGDKGKPCGCGLGKSGCIECGMCEKCGTSGNTCTGSQLQSPNHSSDGVLALNRSWLRTTTGQSSVHHLLTSSKTETWDATSNCQVDINLPQGTTHSLYSVEIYLADGSASTSVSVQFGETCGTLQHINTKQIQTTGRWTALLTTSDFASKKILTMPSFLRLEFSAPATLSFLRLRDVTTVSTPKERPLVVGDRVTLCQMCLGNTSHFSLHLVCC